MAGMRVTRGRRDRHELEGAGAAPWRLLSADLCKKVASAPQGGDPRTPGPAGQGDRDGLWGT